MKKAHLLLFPIVLLIYSCSPDNAPCFVKGIVRDKYSHKTYNINIPVYVGSSASNRLSSTTTDLNGRFHMMYHSKWTAATYSMFFRNYDPIVFNDALFYNYLKITLPDGNSSVTAEATCPVNKPLIFSKNSTDIIDSVSISVTTPADIQFYFILHCGNYANTDFLMYATNPNYIFVSYKKNGVATTALDTINPDCSIYVKADTIHL
jgi:hypothetical protein